MFHGLPGLEYVLVGYSLVGILVGKLGIFLALYLLNCLANNKDPLRYEDELSQQSENYNLALKVCIGYAILSFLLLSVPYGSFLSGLIGHLALILGIISNTTQQESEVICPFFLGGIMLIGLMGWGAINSGIIYLKPEY
ncbi:MAG: hypothetical protein RLZZ338_639 [Cyanobacteriota bacterium]|jgi:hypothetical protein